jgi:tRNA nucleotidyltransferase/poly(A) polymerase
VDFLRKIISESISEALLDRDNNQISTLTNILNSLEFKSDVERLGGEIYAVGGIVRDAILEKKSDDLDIVVRGIPYDDLFKILLKYGKATDTSTEKEEGKDFGATKFVSSNPQFNKVLEDNSIRKEIDIMLPRKDSKEIGTKGHRSIKSDVNPNYTIFDDLKRRDITINAIALDTSGKIIDVGGGKEDIKNGIIRAVSAESFLEDPLRILRAIRFSARFNYNIDPQTLSLIRSSVHLLSDKNELPRERFLMEFEKMIGKTDLGRAVNLIVDLGLYEAMFGIEPKIKNYNRFDLTKNVAEFCYLLFESESRNRTIQLTRDNVTTDNYMLAYLESMLRYNSELLNNNLEFVNRINRLAEIYKNSPDFLLQSFIVSDQDRNIGIDFRSGKMPKGEHDVNFKGEEFKNFVISTIKNNKGDFVPKEDGKKMGFAKNLALQAIYKREIGNDENSIKNFLLKNFENWGI